MTIRIGVHPNNLSLFTLSKKPELLQELLDPVGLSVEWVHYTDGRQTVKRLAAGEIDFGGTGSTPPIQAQADGVPIVYLATSEPRPSHGAIAVLQESAIQSIADLKGKTVALTEGSFLQHLLAVALDREGLHYRDIKTLNLSASDAASAFLKGEADAWVAGDPHLAQSQKTHQVRVLALTADLISDRSVFFTHRAFAENHFDALRAIVLGLDESDRWIASHFQEAAELLASEIGNGVDVAAWEVSLRRRPWGLVPILAEFVAEQQHAADLFYRFGILPTQIQVSQALLPDNISVFEADFAQSRS